MKKTPNTHPDYNNISQALEKIGETVEQGMLPLPNLHTVNAKIKKAEMNRQFYELLKDKAKFVGLEELVAPSREFIERGKVNTNTAEEVGLKNILR